MTFQPYGNILGGVYLVDGSSGNVTPLLDTGGTLKVSAKPYYADIAKGNVPGNTPWLKMGFNGALPANVEVDLAPFTSANYIFPATAQSMSMVSSSIYDGATSAGIQSARIYYLNAAYVEASVNVILAGTTSVNVGVGNIFRIQNIRASAVGSSMSAVGNITLKNQANSLTYGYIQAGNTRQRSLIWTVPANKNLYITSGVMSTVSGAKQAQVKFTLRATFDEKLGTTLTPGTFFMPYEEQILQDSALVHKLEMPAKFPAQTDIKVSVKGDQAGAQASCILDGWIEAV